MTHFSSFSNRKANEDNDCDKKVFNCFRMFKNFTFFYIFFPSLLYLKDFKEIDRKSFRYNLIKKGSLLNKLISSFVGILATWVFTYLLYIYLKHLRVDSNKTSFTLLLFFTIMLIGLAFDNKKFRCTVLLVIPFMATSRGRSIILMTCYKQVVNVILPNIIENLTHLYFCLSCNKKLLCELLHGSAKNSNFVQTS